MIRLLIIRRFRKQDVNILTRIILYVFGLNALPKSLIMKEVLDTQSNLLADLG